MVGGWRQRKRYLVGMRLVRIKEMLGFCPSRTRKYIGKLGSTPVQCSCFLCGNPRRNFGMKTRKEEIQMIDFKEQMDELR